MATSEAIHDRFGRDTVFAVQFKVREEADPKGEIVRRVHEAGARISDLELLEILDDATLYEMTVYTSGDEQMSGVREALAGIEGVEIIHVADLAMESHRGGACEMRARVQIATNTDLRIVYTPGVARVCKAIQADPAKARDYTNIANKVAIVTNGTAILGLGDIGPLAGLPVMEGKAAIFWAFAGISAEPVLIDTHEADEFILVCEKIACGFGAIQIEDVAAPECFRITRELDEKLDIPVFHDDQHGTATIVLAGLYSALRKTGRKIEEMRCAISGAGAAGTAVADLLMRAGVPDVVLCDSRGIVCRGRDHLNAEKAALAERTNRENLSGTLADAMAGRELFIGVSRPNLVTKDMVRSMAPSPIVFAMANPVSEITVAEAYKAGAAVATDGRMMNNALAYPGIFRGALDVGAEAITLEMLTAAAHALADAVPEGELMPEMMDPDTHEAVAKAVRKAAG